MSAYGTLGTGLRRAWRATAGAGTALLVAGVIPVVVLATALPAQAGTDPAHITFTLEGCRGDAGDFPATGPFVCPDADYTTGNLGSGWNELDLVPHRLTTVAGSQAGVTTTYTISIVADGTLDGVQGYDYISVPVPRTPATCSITAGPLTVADPGVGGVDTSLYRSVTITQAAGTTCVFDYYERLALGSAAYSGSSLQSNLANQNLGSQGIGEKRVSIPDVAQPQSLDKDMTATQGSDHVWSVTKSPTPSTLDFGDTCDPSAPASLAVDITVSWTKGAANPSGPVTIVTHVYANNPAHRPVQVSMTDDIYAGTTPSGSPLNSATVSTTVPAETNNYLLLTHTVTLASGPTSFNDVATATYTDTVAGLPPITLTTTDSAVAAVQTGGSELNQTATITDSESITGTGLTFSVATPSVGAFTGGYVAGTPTTGPVGWSSGSQSGSGSVTFHKTVYLDEPRITSGSLDDQADLTGSDGATASATASVSISSSATVSVTVDKTLLQPVNSSQTFTFHAMNGATDEGSTTITFPAGSVGPLSGTISGLTPGTVYVIHEDAHAPYQSQDSAPVTVTLPSCSERVSLTNGLAPATARVKKITNPAGSEAGWSFTLTGPDVIGGSETVLTTGTDYVDFASVLQTDGGVYTITETAQSGWDLTAVSGAVTGGTNPRNATTNVANRTCSITLNLLTDDGALLSCDFTNTQRGSITIVKDAVPDDPQDFGYTTTGSGLSSFSLDDDADVTLSNTRTFTDLVPGSYSVTETLPVTGWDLTAMSCASTNGASNVGVALGTGVSTITLGAGDSVTCRYTNTKRGHVTVLKTENGGTPTHAYTFRLTGGPDNVNISRTTDGTNLGNLDFGLLRPGSYTLCELAVPAGTHSTLEDQGGTLDSTTGDVCLAFTLAAGETRAFTIDNSRPGGGQRTIGYWKNWNSCSGTGKNRVAMAAKTGNHLMDEFLPQTLGGYTVDTCAKGLAVLKAASAKYAENQLAAQLLAAKLNVAAGASTCSSVNTAIAQADALLTSIGYTGPPSSKLGSASTNRSNALALAGFLDQYNNGNVC